MAAASPHHCQQDRRTARSRSFVSEEERGVRECGGESYRVPPPAFLPPVHHHRSNVQMARQALHHGLRRWRGQVHLHHDAGQGLAQPAATHHGRKAVHVSSDLDLHGLLLLPPGHQDLHKQSWPEASPSCPPLLLLALFVPAPRTRLVGCPPHGPPPRPSPQTPERSVQVAEQQPHHGREEAGAGQPNEGGKAGRVGGQGGAPLAWQGPSIHRPVQVLTVHQPPSMTQMGEVR